MNEDDKRLEMTRQKHQTQYMMRTRFSRHGATSYIGHLDLMKVFERACRRARLPLLYSQGYNPRPTLVFALPLGVGINSEGDYVDIATEYPIDAGEFIEKISPELPDGLKVLSARSIGEPPESIMSIVTAASYSLEAEGITGALVGLWGKETVEIEKKAKGGKTKLTDIRPLMIKLLPGCTPDKAEILVYAGSQKNLRPDVLLSALCLHEGYDREKADNCIVTRTDLFGGEYPDIISIDALG